jgi:hypothetical protein
LNYYSFKGDVKNYNKEEQRYLKYIEYESKEQQSKYIFWKILLRFTSVKSITDNFISELKIDIESYREIVFFLKQNDAIYLYNYLLLLFYEICGDSTLVIDVCNDLDDLLVRYPEIDNNMKRYLILYYRLKANLHLNKFDLGLYLINANNKIMPIDSNNNWFALKELEFKLYLQSNNINEAKRVCNEVLKNKFLKRQLEQTIEKWKIFHAYLVFMDSYLNQGNYKFSIPKFLNDVPMSFKDKSGYNFAIRIVEILFLFARKEYNFIFQKMEALRVYRTRYLNDNTYKRNHLLLSMLLKAEKVGFKGREMREVEFIELYQLAQKNNHIIPDWEIIPFEILWLIILNLSK